MGIKRWLKNWLNSNEDCRLDSGKMPAVSYGIEEDTDFSNSRNGLKFTVYNATGGKIVEFKRYDKQTDRQHTGLHLIRDDEDFGEQLTQIITIECLKNGR